MYNLITVYDDGFTKTENCNSETDMLCAAALYAQDKECIIIIGMDIETKKFIIDFTRR